MKFQLPDPLDPRSLKPGSLESLSSRGASKPLKTTSSLNDSIVAARAAMGQFKKKSETDVVTQTLVGCSKQKEGNQVP